MIIGKLKGMIIGDGDENIFFFTKQPLITCDNYFSGDTIFDCARSKGFELLMTVRWYRLPRGVPPQYFHKKPTDPDNSTANCACYTKPTVVATNKEDKETKKKYQKVHVSFQSTSSCNIQAVNML
eukprot:15337084-Ditylum_brightwellii.AAC.1